MVKYNNSPFVNLWKAVVRKCCQRTVVKIAIFSVLGLFVYIYCTQYLYSEQKTLLKDKMGLAYQLIKHNGSFYHNKYSELDTLSEDQRDEITHELREALNVFAAHCHEKSSTCTNKDNKPAPVLLTLFTTFIYDEEKFFVNNNTLFNWKNLPNVNLIVFSNCSTVKHYSESADWHVMPVLHEAASAPVLPSMFQSVMEIYDSVFYGYANADLLFTDDLITTLETIVCEMDLTKSVMVVGKRTNVPISFITQKGSLSSDSVKNIAQKHGTLFNTDAEDYFITTRDFPWKGFLPMAVGRRGYDNWMVSFSRQKRIPVVDITSSSLCVHQTLPSRGNFEGLSKGDYNMKLIEDLNLPYSFGEWGRTSCANIRTFLNLCGNIELEHRKHLGGWCTQYFFMHRVWTALGFT